MKHNEFEPQDLLDNILSASKEFVEKGKDYAESVLNIPESGTEREHKLDGLKKGAFSTAILIGLLGTKGGRSLTGKAIKIGSVAALGTAAYNGYKHWRNKNQGDSIHQLSGDAADQRAFLLIATMVSAANADGKLDDQESTLLKREILDMNLSKDLFDKVTKIVEYPLSATELSRKVADDAIASEVYLAARIFIDDNSEIERRYLNDLVKELGLSAELIAALDGEIA
jgi:uncharacterized membrane protein YebE (DUF533 family)